MRANKELVTAVGTLALAVGIGFVMQSTDDAKDRYDVRTAPAALKTDTVKGASIMPELRKVQLTSATAANIAVEPIGDAWLVAETSDTPLETACGVETGTQVLPGALVQISLDAPCQPNERLTVHHNGLMFTDVTDAEGGMTTTVPAFARDAVFIVAFESGTGAVLQATVEDMVSFTRTALQWSGPRGFELHALEFGADYGSRGHVWSGAEHSVEAALRDNHGFVVPLGDPDVAQPLMAEVYTYPAKEGPVDLRVETEIHAMNCGLDVEVQSIRYGFGNLRSEEVMLSIPDCSLMGDLLVLGSLFENDEVLASR